MRNSPPGSWARQFARLSDQEPSSTTAEDPSSAATEPETAEERPVKPAQVWRLKGYYTQSGYPREYRVVCEYPFSRAEDGRAWVVESAFSFHLLERVPEKTLHALYEHVPMT